MMKELLPFKGEKTVRDRIDEIFSRQMLGSVVVGSSFFKILENLIKYITVGGVDFSNLIISYLVFFALSVILFAYWDEIEQAYQEKAQKEEETTEEKIRKVLEERKGTIEENYDKELEVSALGKKFSFGFKRK